MQGPTTARRYEDKVAVVTGGGSGIGRSIAHRMAAEGGTVAVWDVDAEQGEAAATEIRAAGGEADAFVCDVADQRAVVAAEAAVRDRYGRLDVLVNNAGIGFVGTLEQTSEEDLDRLYRVNVKGVYNGMFACIRGMVDQGGGVILNMASIVSKIGLLERFAYSMTKGAVLTMTLSVARDYIDQGIRCNCICPARIHTPFVDDFLARNYPGREEEVFGTLSAYQPIGRMGTPEEVAALAAFLCSDEAAFITGSAVDIDGGVTLLR